MSVKSMFFPVRNVTVAAEVDGEKIDVNEEKIDLVATAGEIAVVGAQFAVLWFTLPTVKLPRKLAELAGKAADSPEA